MSLKDEVLNGLLGFAKKKVISAINARKWKTLFSETGKFLLASPDKENAFAEDLKLVFSESNLKEIAKHTGHESGFDVIPKLHDELFNLFKKYELESYAETYILYFIETAKQYLKENIPEQYQEAFLADWRIETNHQLYKLERKTDSIIHEVKKIGTKASEKYTIDNIESIIKQQAIVNLDLSFFDWDDEQFQLKLEMEIKQNNQMVYIEGKSKEETLYRVLNLLRQLYAEKETLIIKNQETWEEVSKEHPKDSILIPYFYSDSIDAIPNNINIFIYSEEEHCNRRNKIKLRKRTRKNIIDALKKVGFEYDQAYRLIEKTHGLYAPMKRALFNTETFPKPSWVDSNSDVILAALLCGMWTDAEGDQEVLQALSGRKYEECLSVLKQYDHGENPFILSSSYRNEEKSVYQIASVEEAWVMLRPQISVSLRDKFIKIFVEVLCCPDKKCHTFEEYYNAIKDGANQSKWSKSIKKGMIRSFILWTCIQEEASDQALINKAVNEILKAIDTTEKWEYISDYMTDLCEAAPESVLDRLESELISPTGMKELFVENTDYTSILWAVEQLIQQSPYLIRSIKWLWEMDSYNIQYKINNSPRSILENVFCAWINLTPLKKHEKIREAEKAVSHYANAWDIIASCLPKHNNMVFSSLNKPFYKDVDIPEVVYRTDLNEIYHSYLLMCINTIGDKTNRWITIIDNLTSFDKDTIEKVLDQLIDSTRTMNDDDKTLIKEKIREIIYHHRYFQSSEWAMTESDIQLFENKMNQIIPENPVFDYLYLFHPDYDFPLLHPIPYDEQADSSEQHDKNEEKINEEISNKIQEFKANKYSIHQLIELEFQRQTQTQIGRVLALHYDHGKFNSLVFECLLHQDNNSLQAYEYAREVSHNTGILCEVIAYAKEYGASNDLIADLISLQLADDIENTIIFHETDNIKKAFWTRERGIHLSEKAHKETLFKALEDCAIYGTLQTYTALLFTNKERLSPEELYQALIQVKTIQSFTINSMTCWYFEKTLELIQKHYMEDEIKCYEISQLEWWASNLLNWDQMRCTNKLIKKDVRVYAKLVDIVCRKDKGTPDNPERKQLANKLYSRFRDIKFCPAEEKGTVNYTTLRQWVEDFKTILENQHQTEIWDLLVGELLPYSPIGEDGVMPCKAVRQLIEEYHTENMIRGYITTVLNSRGVYVSNAGKGEEALAAQYAENAKKIERESPHTAGIYRELSREYKEMAREERKLAEDVW